MLLLGVGGVDRRLCSRVCGLGQGWGSGVVPVIAGRHHSVLANIRTLEASIVHRQGSIGVGYRANLLSDAFIVTNLLCGGFPLDIVAEDFQSPGSPFNTGKTRQQVECRTHYAEPGRWFEFGHHIFVQ